jgi:hypothetical protein
MTPRQRALVASCFFGGLVFIALILSSPKLVADFAKQNLLPPVDIFVAALPRYGGPVFQVAPVIRIHAPTILLGSDSERLSISVEKTLLGHSDDLLGHSFSMNTDSPRWDVSDVDKPFVVQLAVPKGLTIDPSERRVERSFKDAKSLDEPPLNWHWALAADSPGQHKLLLQGLPLARFPVRLQTPSGEQDILLSSAKVLPEGTLELTIQALTSLGLTARQDALMKAIHGLAGFLGIILAYPVFKRLFDRDKKDADNRKPRRRRSG